MSFKLSARIQKEIRVGILSDEFEFMFDAEGIYGDANTAYLRFTIKSGTYEGQTHILRMKFIYGSNQPYVFPGDPPNVTFETPIFHTNIATGGSICLDVIQKDKWSPMYGIETIFHSIIALLDSPNTSSPFNSDASLKYTRCSKANIMDKYKDICMEYYKNGTPASIEHRIWKILHAPEFDLCIIAKLEKHKVPKSQWPKGIESLNELETEPGPKTSD